MKIKKVKKKFLEYYYMIPAKVDVKELSKVITTVSEKQIEIWKEINLMEIVLTSDSLIFEDAKNCFIDPLDLAFLKEHQIETIYQISFEQNDGKKVIEIFKELMQSQGGFLASDSEDFTPTFTIKNIDGIVRG